MGSLNLDMESSAPLYRQLMQRLRDDIAAGVYPVSSRIPSEPALCSAYGVSRVTVRRALEELTKEGLLQRRQGKGTFVSTPHLFRDLKHINSFGSVCRMTGATPGTQVIRTAVIPAGEEDLTHQLAPSGGSVVETVRLRLANHEPVMLETNHFPIRFDWLLEEDLSGSLYDVLRRRKAEPRDAIHEISLVYADGDTAQMLDVPEGTALLQLDQMIFDQNGQPLHSSRQLIRGDRFTFRI